MKVGSIKARMNKDDLIFAHKKMGELIEKLPDGDGDLREYYWVTITKFSPP